MNNARSLFIAAVGFGLFQVGCANVGDGAEAGVIGGVPRETMDPPDSDSGTNGGHNGLLDDSFHDYKDVLAVALTLPLHSPWSGMPDVSSTGLLDTPEGREVFSYAVRCAIPKDTIISYPRSTYTYIGGGLLNTTGAWLTGLSGLGTSAREDVFACLLAHINPYDVEVPISLTGDTITNNASFDDSDFDFSEALWTAEISASAGMMFHVWPLDDMKTTCGDPAVVNNEIFTRICLNNATNCDIQIHEDLTDCTKDDDGHYTCRGRSAIETRLNPYDGHPVLGCLALPR